MSQEERLALEVRRVSELETELRKAHVEIARARDAALNGRAEEEERRRLEKEEAVRSKEKRVQHYTQAAMHRLGRRGLSLSFSEMSRGSHNALTPEPAALTAQSP